MALGVALGGAGGGGGAPSGPAGGVLSGTYPDPGFAADMATQAELNAVESAAIAADAALDTRVDVLESAVAGARAYWMVFVEATQGAGSNARIGELQLRATPGGANIATGGTPIFLDQASGSGDNSAAAAYDGNSATAWASASTTMPSGVGYQLATPSPVNEIVITARNDAFGPNGAPSRFILLSSSDGVSWQFEWRVLSSTGWTAGLSRTFTRPS